MPMKPPKPTKKYTPGRKRKTKKIVYKTGSKMRGSARRKITAMT